MLKQEQALNLTFHALSDPTRRRMLEQLGRGGATVSELAEPLQISLPAVMQHLQVLEESGLVRSTKQGRVRTCRLELRALQGAEEWLSARRDAWQTRFDRLDVLLTEPTKGTKRRGKT